MIADNVRLFVRQHNGVLVLIVDALEQGLLGINDAGHGLLDLEAGFGPRPTQLRGRRVVRSVRLFTAGGLFAR